MARQPLNAYLTRVLPGGALTMNPGGQLYIYEEGTTDEANVWDAKVGGDTHSQPLSADADGSFPGHYVEDDRDYDRVVVGDSLNATQAWRVRKGTRYVIYPRDYGAVEDGETDETEALRDCIDDAIAHDKDVTVAFRPITYIVDGDPVTDRTGNAILPIVGNNVTESVTLEGQGLGYNSPRRTILKTTRTADTYDADLGPPSVIGGQTEEAGSGGVLACGPVTLRGISVEVPNNPAIAGIDAISFGGLMCDRAGVIAGTGADATETPANEWAFGLRLPGAYAFGLIDLRGFKSRQMYAGIVLRKADHIMFGAGSGAVRCVIGLAFEEHDTEGGPPLGGGYVQLDACKYLLAGWNPVDGVKSIDTDMTRRVINGLRVEAEPTTTGLFAETASVLDANDKLIGRISLHRGASDFFSGAAQGTITGAQNLDIYNPVNPNLATRRTTIPADVDVMTSQLVIWLDDTPGDVRVMFKAKASDGAVRTGELGVSSTPAPDTFEFSASLAATAAVAASAEVVGEPPVGAGLPASELYLWGGGGSAPTGVALDNTEMTWLDARGFKHIHMGIGRLSTFGGTQDFRADGGSVTAAQYDYQEQIQNSDFVDRWHAYGADHKAYIQWDAPHTNDPPGAAIASWYDDTAWTSYCGKLEDLAAYGNWQGFDGISSDWEVFNNNRDAWHWDRWSTTDTHTEAQVKQKAFDRGAQMMTAILAGMPNADVYVYNMFEPDGWHAIRGEWDRDTQGHPSVQIKAEGWVQWDLFLGMASVAGYSALRTNTAEFQKVVNPGALPSGAEDWANAFRYSVNHFGALCSQELSSADWEYAHTRVKWMPFSWIDEIVGATSSSFSYKKSAAYVNTQLQEMRRYGMGGMLPNFDHSGFNTASYVDHNGVSYDSAFANASDDTVVDSTAPSLPVPTLGGSTITGTATDNLAMWAVKWEDNAGGSGMAECDYQITSNSSPWPAIPEAYITGDRFNWTIQLSAITPAATSVTITAVDSHMNESTPRVVSGI